MPRSSVGSQREAGIWSSQSSRTGPPAVRYGCEPVPYGAGREPALQAETVTRNPHPGSHPELTDSSKQDREPWPPYKARDSAILLAAPSASAASSPPASSAGRFP